MFLVLLFLTVCLHAVHCPWWQSRTGVMTQGGRLHVPEPRLPTRRTRCQWGWRKWRYHPPAHPPSGGTRPGPSGRPMGVYTPTAHEGAPARGDGPGFSLWDGCNPGSGEGPHTAVGGWRYNTGRSRRGTAASPSTRCGKDGGRDPPPEPPPTRGTIGAQGASEGRALPVQGTSGAGDTHHDKEQSTAAPLLQLPMRVPAVYAGPFFHFFLLKKRTKKGNK